MAKKTDKRLKKQAINPSEEQGKERATAPWYPILARKSSLSKMNDRRVRMLLNEQTAEGDEAARRELFEIDLSKRGAEWYFLSGCLRHRKGHIADATAMIDRAIELAGDKAPDEYRKVYDRIMYMSEHPDEPLPPGEEEYKKHRECFCADALPDCCCECCGEGCCEVCCTGWCEGCDCS